MTPANMLHQPTTSDIGEEAHLRSTGNRTLQTVIFCDGVLARCYGWIGRARILLQEKNSIGSTHFLQRVNIVNQTTVLQGLIHGFTKLSWAVFFNYS